MTNKGYKQSISTAEFLETPTLVLEQPTGDVYVEGWDRQEIEVSIDDEGIFEVEQNGSQVMIRNRPGKFKLVDFLEPAADELRDFGVDLNKVSSRVERGIERSVERGMRRMGRNFNWNIDVSNWKGGRDYHIMVPQSCDLILRTSTGDMTVVGVGGTLSLQSSSGDIVSRVVSGNIIIATASGDVSVNDLEGKLAVRTASGDIKAQTIGVDEVSVNTASGDVELDLTLLPERNFDLKTVSGGISLLIPFDSAFKAEVRTLSGSISCGFPRSAVEYTARHKRETILTINGGSRTLQLQTVSGDVTLRPRRSDSQPTANMANRSANSTANSYISSGSPTIRTGGASTMNLSSTDNATGESANVDDSHGDITKSEGYAARKQAELEILEKVARGELTSQEALAALSSLDSE
jgi:DUF4097 and DUF4098 domain-containing protein YvlB